MERCKICDGALYFNEEIWDYACPRCEPEKVKPKCPKCEHTMRHSLSGTAGVPYVRCVKCGYYEKVKPKGEERWICRCKMAKCTSTAEGQPGYCNLHGTEGAYVGVFRNWQSKEASE